MQIETIQAGDATRYIRRLEQLLEMPIGALVVTDSRGQLAFVVPDGADESYASWLLGWVHDSTYNAAKSRPA
jgi:hypothetical protein